MKVVVIGSGAMGLAAAYQAAIDGHEVVVLEAAPEPGGMAGHFDFDGISLERFYHFVCKSDEPTFALLSELGILDKLHWRVTSMGFFSGRRLYKWGEPLALLQYPGMSWIEKFRYGLFVSVCVRRDSWPEIEQQSAREWIIRWCGTSLYEHLWKPLFEHKFYEYAENISAAWIWRRIRRVGRSRRSPFQEELGYIEGGSITLINALIDKIRSLSGAVHLGHGVRHIHVANPGTPQQSVTGVETCTPAGLTKLFPADAVICTVPTPYVAALVPDLSPDWKARYESIHNIGVICVIFKLKRSVSPHFWVNLSEPYISIPGIIEFSNLRDVGGDTIVYVPYYMPTTHPKFSWSDEQLIGEAFMCLQYVNPVLTWSDVLVTKVARLRHGQPICEPGFAAKIPPTQTPVAGLQIADTCYYYPEDRGIAESVRLGRKMAKAIRPKS